MSELKATPGTWVIGNESNSSVDLQIGETFACFDRENLNTFEPVISREEMLANAHLATAAPELYEALTAVVDFGNDANTKRGSWALAKAHAALAKARGES